MSYTERHTLSITVDASGDATVFTPVLNGKLNAIIYNKTDWVDPASPVVGPTFLITTETTGQTLWSESGITSSKDVAPRQPTHDSAGAASLYAGAGEAVEDKYAVVEERIKVVISAAGNATSGEIIILME